MTRKLSQTARKFVLKMPFRISRWVKTEAETVQVTIEENGHIGRGECVPYARYGETIKSVENRIHTMKPLIEAGLSRADLQHRLPAGAARNALDCALWDLEAKMTGKPVWELAGLEVAPTPVNTAMTLSLDTPENMAKAAVKAIDYPLLKLKLTGEGDLERLKAVRDAAPDAKLIIDANEGWTLAQLKEFAPHFAAAGVDMIEQPLPSDKDAQLKELNLPIKLAADESCHSAENIEELKGCFDILNIKLDKTGGLTEALKLKKAALEQGFEVMIGCMICSSLSIAPAILLAQNIKLIDLDGPLWLKEDVPQGLIYDNATVAPPTSLLWG